MNLNPTPFDPQRFAAALHQSGLSIYDPIPIGHPTLWIPAPELQTLLDEQLRGLVLAGLALRTRSKVVKESVCRALGYPVPRSFRKSQPRFPGQQLDVYIQKSNNLQIWNEELAPTRRYALIRVADSDVISRVKIVTGDTLASLDSTGTLTKKYQARCLPGSEAGELIAPVDTSVLAPFAKSAVDLPRGAAPTDYPRADQLLSIRSLFARLSALLGRTFRDAGFDQERNRGAALHALVCEALGYDGYRDDGQFPDVRHQLLEVKLQTSPTIDLGLVRPSSVAPLDVPMIRGVQVRHCDVRYAVFYAEITEGTVRLTHLFLTTGEAFFSRFPQFGGNVLNAKLQIPLPRDFFDV